MSAIFHYFWKNKVLLGYFERNTLKTNLTYSCFIFPLFHKHLFSPELPHAAHILKISCFEKITVCVIETMLVTLPLVQMNKARREVSQQIKYKLRKNCDSSYNVFKWLKKYFTTFQVVVLCKSSCKSTYCNSLNLLVLCKSSCKSKCNSFNLCRL